MRIARHREAVWEEEGSSVFVVSPRDGEILVLSASASLIWNLLDQPLEPDALVAGIADASDAEPDVIRADVGPFLDELRQRGLVVDHG